MFSFLKKPPKPSVTEEWPFDQGRSTEALTTRQVMRGGSPVLQVTHYADDHSWAFTCGTTNETEDAMLVSMEQVISRDPSLFGIADLPPGWSAWRASLDAPWQRQADAESD